jgi:hypothetical protein
MARRGARPKLKATSGRLLFLAAGRTRYIALLIDEVEILVVALYGMFQQNLRFASAALRFVANIALTIDKVKEFFVVSLEFQLLDLLRHGGAPSILH